MGGGFSNQGLTKPSTAGQPGAVGFGGGRSGAAAGAAEDGGLVDERGARAGEVGELLVLEADHGGELLEPGVDEAEHGGPAGGVELGRGAQRVAGGRPGREAAQGAEQGGGGV